MYCKISSLNMPFYTVFPTFGRLSEKVADEFKLHLRNGLHTEGCPKIENFANLSKY